MTNSRLQPSPMGLVDGSVGFDAASEAVLDFLDGRLPWALWSITRIENGQQTMLRVHDREYDINPGDSVAWSDSICVRMTAGDGPAVAPDAQAIPAYAEQAINDEITIGAYAGAPISDEDGSLFGVLCGINASPVQDESAQDIPLLELLGRLLGMVLAADRDRDRIELAAQHDRLAAETDSLTGVLSRRGWDALVVAEEERQQRYADPLIVVVADLDGLKALNDGQGHAEGDEYLRRAAKALSGGVRDSDPVARLGGDEFVVLLRDTTIADAPSRVQRLRAALEVEGVSASLGWAPHRLSHGFADAIAVADAAMYADKTNRRAGR